METQTEMAFPGDILQAKPVTIMLACTARHRVIEKKKLKTYKCKRPENHDGPHQAISKGKVIHEWS